MIVTNRHWCAWHAAGRLGHVTFRRLFGGDVDPVLKPVLAAVGFGALGQFAFFAFFAIWALTARGAEATEVGLAYTCSALAAVVGSLLGGRVSDRVGRQPVIVAASLVQMITPAALLVPGLPPALAYGVLVVMGFIQPVRGTAQRALLADLVADEGREEAYGAFRVVLNAGATLGPLAGAALVTWRWNALFVAIVCAYALALVAALRLPESARSAAAPAASSSMAPLLRDTALMAVFGATIGGWFAYGAFELLAPVSLTQTHGLAPATWGVLFATNPIVIVVLQLRVTRWTAAVPRGRKLAVAVLLMASPYAVLEFSAALGVVLIVLLVVVLGEMLWAPASEALIANMAPPGLRGLYLGTANAASWTGLALAPAAGLQARAEFGDAGMWLVVLAVGIVGAALYLVACRRVEQPLQESGRDRPSLRHDYPADTGDARGDRNRRGRGRAEARGPDGQPAGAPSR
jgi:predicted MFS family arabinose efflux permease